MSLAFGNPNSATDGVKAFADVANVSVRHSEKMAHHSTECAHTATNYVTSTPCFADGKVVKQSVKLSDSAFSDIIKPGSRRLSNIDDLRGFSLDSGTDTCCNVSIEDVSMLPIETASSLMNSGVESGDSGCYSGLSHIDSHLSVVEQANSELSDAEAVKFHRKADSALPSYTKDGIECDFMEQLSCMPIVQHHILSFLSDDDLLRAMRVSRVWHDAVQMDSHSKQRVDRCKKERLEYKENITGGLRPSASKRTLTQALQPLDLIQSTSSITSLTPDGSQPPGSVAHGRSRFEWFCEEASKLSSGERLRKCPRCQSPARVDPSEYRAHCTMKRCDFDYCLRCDKPYHGSTACRKSGTRGSEAPAAVGSLRSRKNLRRL